MGRMRPDGRAVARGSEHAASPAMARAPTEVPRKARRVVSGEVIGSSFLLPITCRREVRRGTGMAHQLLMGWWPTGCCVPSPMQGGGCACRWTRPGILGAVDGQLNQ
ncbi:hypothetical protein ACFFX0_32125 [Citricoccus parietis]|uniref:Uncharacterized protein n=1 Tax=Citricoccus parietis TaxID=592307 RepID=A0ABV5G9E8_9MICC